MIWTNEIGTDKYLSLVSQIVCYPSKYIYQHISFSFELSLNELSFELSQNKSYRFEVNKNKIKMASLDCKQKSIFKFQMHDKVSSLNQCFPRK